MGLFVSSSFIMILRNPRCVKVLERLLLKVTSPTCDSNSRRNLLPQWNINNLTYIICRFFFFFFWCKRLPCGLIAKWIHEWRVMIGDFYKNDQACSTVFSMQECPWFKPLCCCGFSWNLRVRVENSWFTKKSLLQWTNQNLPQLFLDQQPLRFSMFCDFGDCY